MKSIVTPFCFIENDRTVGVEQNYDPLRSEVVMLPECLKTSGDITGISGKWHLDSIRAKEAGKNHDPALAPQHQGFDEYFTGL